MDSVDLSTAENFATSISPDVFGFAFAIPALLGLGDHWYLTDNEEEECAAVGNAFIKSRPKVQRKEWEKWINNYMPIVMMMLVYGAIVGKRCALTYEMFKASQKKRKPNLVEFKQQLKTNGRNQDVQSSESTPEESTEESAGNYSDTANESGIAGKSTILSDPLSQTFSQRST